MKDQSNPDEVDNRRIAALEELDDRVRQGGVIDSDSRLALDALNPRDSGLVECIEALHRVLARRQVPAAPPQVIDRYHIFHALGAGGFGIVYLAQDLVLDRRVALKLPKAHTFENAFQREQFLREARAAARLDHPHIVPVYTVGIDGGTPFIASAYCSGGTLRTWLNARTEIVPPRIATAIVIQMADAIDHAHSLGILHRDLKPGNILLSGDPLAIVPIIVDKSQDDTLRLGDSEDSSIDGEPAPRLPRSPQLETSPLVSGNESDAAPYVRVSDFGLAKFVTADAENTESGTVFGTANYMAPEQLLGQTDLVGPHTDVYAMGVILFELLAGRVPFVRNGQAPRFDCQSPHDDPPSLRRIRRDVPYDLDLICQKCLATEHLHRYSTAQALATDLRRYLEGAPISARPRSRFDRMIKWSRRRPAAAALLIVSAVSLTTILAIQADRQRNMHLLNRYEPRPRERETLEAQWQQVFSQLPRDVTFPWRKGTGKIAMDGELSALSVTASHLRLAEVCKALPQSFDLSFTLMQPGWQADAGVFLGYHEGTWGGVPASDFQVLWIARSLDRQGNLIVELRRRLAVVLPEIGSLESRADLASVQIDWPPPQPTTLSFSVRNGVMTEVRWCGQPVPGLCTESVNARVPNASNCGPTGVFVRAGSCWFRDPLLKFVK